jgi:SAM-dependent methyltransferase
MQPPINPVRQQYEALPFPYRNPEDETWRLVTTGLDHLGKVSHFCFGGALDLSGPFRVLVAGGGTGDATIFLAEQLRNNKVAAVVHLDLSAASIEVAKRRAEKRGLTNITWIQQSILNIDPGAIGTFNYINCAGVLHHMPEPSAGLRRLKAVLAEGGGMGLMVYGRYGRSSIYEVQDLMRIIRIEDCSYEQRAHHARTALASLSPLHSHVRGWPIGSPTGEMDDANIFDTYLHPQDVAYTVPELYGLVESEGLHIIAFGDFDSTQPILRIEYDPATYVADADLLAVLKRLPVKEQQAAAELMNGIMSVHSFYVSANPDAYATFATLDHISYFHDNKAVELAQACVSNPSFRLELRCKKAVSINLSQAMRRFLARVNDRNTIGEILHAITDGNGLISTDAQLTRLRPELELLNSVNVLLLRKRSTLPYCFVTHLPEK